MQANPREGAQIAQMYRSSVSVMAAAAFAIGGLRCATAGADGNQSASSSSLLGRAEQFAGTALSVAKSFLAKTPPQQQPDKDGAAQAGVSAANTEAQQQQGSALSQLEQQALLAWVKSKI